MLLLGEAGRIAENYETNTYINGRQYKKILNYSHKLFIKKEEKKSESHIALNFDTIKYYQLTKNFQPGIYVYF